MNYEPLNRARNVCVMHRAPRPDELLREAPKQAVLTFDTRTQT